MRVKIAKILWVAMVVFSTIAMGVYLIKWYISTMYEGTSPVLGLLGAGFVIFGIALALISVIKSFFAKKESDTIEIKPTEGGNVVLKNTQLINEYQKLNANRDKLKLLKYATALEEQDK